MNLRHFIFIISVLTLPILTYTYPHVHSDTHRHTNVESAPPNKTQKEEIVSASGLSSMYQLQESLALPKREGRLQGVSVKGRLMCGSEPIVGGRVKIVDIDKSKLFGGGLWVLEPE
jgi:hypothetical protein